MVRISVHIVVGAVTVKTITNADGGMVTRSTVSTVGTMLSQEVRNEQHVTSSFGREARTMVLGNDGEVGQQILKASSVIISTVVFET